jgi:hypothetical protein
VVEPPYLPANPNHEQIPDYSMKEKFSAKLKQRTDKPASQVEKLPKHVPIK